MPSSNSNSKKHCVITNHTQIFPKPVTSSPKTLSFAVACGAANTVDVRSDFFAAWFLVRGYREDDVEGLEPGEPMRPTYEKRFLMVLDRSNVTESGELPRVLFIREVPL